MLELGSVTPRSSLRPLVFGWLICLFFITALILLFTGTYARKEEITGHIQTRDIVRITSERSAHIKEVLVGAGEAVKKGQPLLQMLNNNPEIVSGQTHTTSSSASAERLEHLLADRLADEASARSTHDAQQQLLHLQLNSTVQQSIQRRAYIALEQKQRHERLAEQQAISQADLNAATVHHESVLQDLATNELARTHAQQRLLELEQASLENEQALTRRLSELARQDHELREQLQNLHKNQEYVLLSPVDGVVDSVSVFSGSRADIGLPMIVLRIDQPSLHAPVVVLEVSPSAIGFAHVGSEVIVRIDAFPYARYGVIKGSIVHSTSSTYLNTTPIGTADPARNGQVYLVEVNLDFEGSRTQIQQGWLKDGMTLRASLSLERLNLMQWLFLPVLKGIERTPDPRSLPPTDGHSV
jgi:membrane fusion protein